MSCDSHVMIRALHTGTYVHACVMDCIQKCLLFSQHTPSPTPTHPCTHAHTYTHTHPHTHTHTHTHTHILLVHKVHTLCMLHTLPTFFSRTSIESTCVEALFNLGLVHKRMSRIPEAVDCFMKLHTFLRSSPQVIFQIADWCVC